MKTFMPFNCWGGFFFFPFFFLPERFQQPTGGESIARYRWAYPRVSYPVARKSGPKRSGMLPQIFFFSSVIIASALLYSGLVERRYMSKGPAS